jgi:hypothetical protein
MYDAVKQWLAGGSCSFADAAGLPHGYVDAVAVQDWLVRAWQESAGFLGLGAVTFSGHRV